MRKNKTVIGHVVRKNGTRLYAMQIQYPNEIRYENQQGEKINFNNADCDTFEPVKEQKKPDVFSQDIKFLNDLAAYILFEARERKRSMGSILATIGHDLTEYDRNRAESWFCPRTSGSFEKKINRVMFKEF